MSSSRLRSSAVSLIGRFMVPFSRAREQTDRRGLGHEGAKARQAPEGAADAPLASCCKILNTDRRRERTLPLHRRRWQFATPWWRRKTDRDEAWRAFP